MGKNEKVVLVMPAYNAAKTLIATYHEIPKNIVDDVILVDDGSEDETVEIAMSLGIRVIRHPHNAGYGSNQKTCYLLALQEGADIIIMLHPDNQYDPSFIPEIIKPIQQGTADVVLGSRMLNPRGALKGGMPIYKFLANKVLTLLENIVLGQKLSEFHTGYRAYNGKFLKTVPFLRNSNDFVFDTQIIVQAVRFGFSIAETPVTTRYFPEASSVGFKTSTIYGFKTLWVLLRYLLHQSHLLKAKFLMR